MRKIIVILILCVAFLGSCGNATKKPLPKDEALASLIAEYVPLLKQLESEDRETVSKAYVKLMDYGIGIYQLQESEASFVLSMRYYWDNEILVQITIANPLLKKQRIPFRCDLLPEFSIKHIKGIMLYDVKDFIWKSISLESKDINKIIKDLGLVFKFDAIKKLYYITHNDPEGIALESGEFKKIRVNTKNVWAIPRSVIDKKISEAEKISKQLKDAPEYGNVKNDIDLIKKNFMYISYIQKGDNTTPPCQYIFAYRFFKLLDACFTELKSRIEKKQE